MLEPTFHRPPPPSALPPDQVRIVELRAEPWPGGRRVRVHLTITPFEQNPNLDVVLTAPDGSDAARTAIIETAEARIVFTMHNRSAVAAGSFTVTVHLSYSALGVVDTQSTTFTFDPAAGGDA